MTELICSLCRDTFTTANDAEASDALAKQQELGGDDYWIVCPNCDDEQTYEKRILNPIFPIDFEMNLTKILIAHSESEDD